MLVLKQFNNFGNKLKACRRKKVKKSSNFLNVLKYFKIILILIRIFLSQSFISIYNDSFMKNVLIF